MAAGKDATTQEMLRHLTIISLKDLRLHVIFVLRILCLFRSTDLANLQRLVPFGGSDNSEPYVLVRRKGWRHHKWEKLLVLEENVLLSPWHLLQAYVNRTEKQGASGGPMFLSLARLFKGLRSAAIGSIAKEAFRKFGINTNIFGPHSTRGAGVCMYKRMGLSAENVCEIGQWKSVTSFAQHYQRLKSVNIASAALKHFVHNASSSSSAEPQGSRTPPSGLREGGGSDPGGEAQMLDEPALTPRKRERSPASEF